MKPAQQIFVNEVLRHGDKTQAYIKAYPKTKDSAVPAAMARLMNVPEVDELLNTGLVRMRAELETELREKMQLEIVDELQVKLVLSKIIRGEMEISKEIWTKEGKQTLIQYPGFTHIIRSIFILGKSEGWFGGSAKKQGEGERAKKEKENGSGSGLAWKPKYSAEEWKVELAKRKAKQAEEAAIAAERRKGKFEDASYLDVMDHYEALTHELTEDEKDDKNYFIATSFYRDRDKGIDNPRLRPEEREAAEKDSLLTNGIIMPTSITTYQQKNNDENLTNASSLTQLKRHSELTIINNGVPETPRELTPEDLQKLGYKNIESTYFEERRKYFEERKNRGYYDNNGYAYTHPPSGSCYYCEMDKLYTSRNKPIEDRRKIAAGIGYELHEQYPAWTRKKRKG